MKQNTMTELTNMKPTHCAQCHEALPSYPPTHVGGTGYAWVDPGDPKNMQAICYGCADKRCIEALKDRSQPFIAYVGKGIITTWTGGKLMTIVSARPCTLTRVSHFHDRKSYMSIHAVDVHGGHWAGRGSEGIAIKLRAVKGS